MQTLQAPSRNLLSHRTSRPVTAWNIADYLGAVRSPTPWGHGDRQSPLWHAGIATGNGLISRVTAYLAALTRTEALRSTEPLASLVGQYLADAATLQSEVAAVNRLVAAVAVNQVRMPIDEPQWTAKLSAAEITYRRENDEKSRQRVGAELLAVKDPGAVLGAPIIAAPILAAGPAAALAAFAADIARRRKAAADYLWEMLMAALGGGLLGIVAWHSDSVCWYVRPERWLRSKGDWRQFAYDRWQAIKQITLIDAMQLEGVPGWLEVPSYVQNVLDAVPPFLHAEVATVVGTMVGEREISWVAGDYQLPATEVVPLRRPVFDPAIAIGNLVLTGFETPEHRKPGWWQRLDMALAK